MIHALSQDGQAIMNLRLLSLGNHHDPSTFLDTLFKGGVWALRPLLDSG